MEWGDRERKAEAFQCSSEQVLLPGLLYQCEAMLEEFEDVVGDWYFHHQEQPLQHFLCGRHVLPATETGKCKSLGSSPSFPAIPGINTECFFSFYLACLQETWTGKEKISDGQEETEEEEEEKEENKEITKTSGTPKHDPEDL